MSTAPKQCRSKLTPWYACLGIYHHNFEHYRHGMVLLKLAEDLIAEMDKQGLGQSEEIKTTHTHVTFYLAQVSSCALCFYSCFRSPCVPNCCWAVWCSSGIRRSDAPSRGGRLLPTHASAAAQERHVCRSCSWTCSKGGRQRWLEVGSLELAGLEQGLTSHRARSHGRFPSK